ncbi:nitrogenase component 1 [Mitsuokella sp. oral taxon 131]|uniref:nitrogenase component 1 n=1 Tax=Mitsuokella sp. oral taxon 131 TaxID=1321780 RepID=UPI0003ADA8FC|nr:nitrogenase component 1 [Mitsuokella sp. oral taxon 131]ERL03541.1 oxidoreductase, nitrogenase component 1 [Mitsuokella sp. oral taxon 131 str. W9106]
MGTEAKRVMMRRMNCSCSMPGVWRALSFVRGALVIFHSPRPCAHIAHGMDVGSFHRLRAAGAKVRLSPVPLLTSSLSDAEAIFGGEDRLRECIRFAAEKYRPQAIFIANSCVSGVIGDDTCAVAEEMEQELGLPVCAVSAHGFLDGAYYAGYLDAARVLVDRFMKPAERCAGSVVLLGDCGGFHGAYVEELCRLLGLLPLRVAGQFPSYLALSEMDVVPAAELLIVLGQRSDEKQALLVDLARHIQERFGTPYLADVYAVGSEETKEWLRAVGRLCGREWEAEEAIRAEESAFQRAVDEVRPTLAERRVTFAIGRDLDWFQPKIIMRLLKKAGVELAGVVLLDSFLPGRREVMEEEVVRLTDAPISYEGSREAEELFKTADFVLTTHELTDARLRQIFLALMPSVGWSMEKKLLRDMVHIVCRHESRGGLIYG